MVLIIFQYAYNLFLIIVLYKVLEGQMLLFYFFLLYLFNCWFFNYVVFILDYEHNSSIIIVYV